MNTPAAVIVIMSNYLHDTATALLAACGLVLWIAVRRMGPGPRPETIAYVRSLRRSMSRIVIGSLIWVTVGAIPRILFFRDLEYTRAAEAQAVSGIIARNVLALFILIAGIVLWISGTRLLKGLPPDSQGLSRP